MENIIKLYRYRVLNPYTFDSIKESFIWFSNPLKFNDPFDCQLFSEYSWLKKQINSGEITDESDILQDYYKNHYKKVIFKVFTDNSIACFSETKDEILMWSHYADHHKGICLEYEAAKLPENVFTLCKPVIYCKKYPKLDFSKFLQPGIKNTTDFIDRMILTKSEAWKYEKEWRIVLPGYGNKAVKFPPALLTAVYMGCNISSENRNALIDLLIKRPEHTEIYQCEKMKNSFSLKFSLIK
ncbi:MAG: DUF2971 domain-containing protein [Mangrovibacterium sp.]